MNEFTTTPNLGLKKPFYNADAEQWGYHINENSDRLDSVWSHDSISVIIEGADPSGVLDSTQAFRDALATGRNVFVPRGTYLITGQLHLATENGPQTLFGEGHSSILLIDQRFDPTVTTGVIWISGIHDKADSRGQVSNLIIKFVQPTDIITTATIAVAAGNSSVIVASAAGIKVGMSVVDITHWVIPTVCLFTEDIPALVTSVSGNTITFDKVIVNEGILAGDSIHFASVRSMFKTLADGGTAGPGGTGIKYPWAIYNTTGESTTLRDLMIINAWDGIWLRGSSFTIEKVDCGAFDIGLDIDDCYNFPTVNNFRFWLWGYFSATVPHERTAFAATFYDGVTVCANFGETDGVGIYNLQSWTGIVNLTARWSWGEFVNLMLDGNNASLNIRAAGGGFAQFTSGYSSKGHTLTTPIYINTPIGFHSHFVNFDLGSASPFNNGIVIDGGTVTFGESSMWDGLQSSREFIQVNNASVLTLRNMLLNAGGGGVNNYIKLTGTATLHMSDTQMVRNVTGLTDAFYYLVSGTATTPVYLDNIFWNGWKVSLPAGVGRSINVLDYGADPTGTYDSSYAINLAAGVVGPNGRHQAVYLPTGTYRVNFQINLTASQGMFGDARGASVLYVDDKFDKTAQAVIMCSASNYDPGPVLRDFGIDFAQPQDQTSRANFKTLAAGGTSGPGGTGVKYPWAISSSSTAFRIQIIRVRIAGAWDGITSNQQNTVFYLDDIEMGALDCGLSLGEGPVGIQDVTHIKGYHYWNFGFSLTLYTNVFSDGQNIAMRVGRVDGLEIDGFFSHNSRLIVTPDANSGSILITNCLMDTDLATIEVNGPLTFFHIANLAASAGTVRQRPFLSINEACPFSIVNHYSHSSSNFPDFLLTHNSAILSITNFRCLFYTTGTAWATIQRGRMRITSGLLFAPGPRTVATIDETLNGRLIVDNLNVSSSGGSTVGPLISMVTNNPETRIGAITMEAGAAWTFNLPAALTQTFYSPVTRFNNGTISGLGSLFANTLVQVGGGSFAGSVAIAGPAGNQKALTYYRGSNIAWAWMSQTAVDDMILGRWNDAGTFLDNPIAVSRATGVVTINGLAVTGTVNISTLAISGSATVAGNFTVGTPAGGGSTLAIQGASGTNRNLVWYRGANPAWSMAAKNATDDLFIGGFSDAGTYLGDSISITRSTGTVAISRWTTGLSPTIGAPAGPSVVLNIQATAGTAGKTITFWRGGTPAWGLAVQGTNDDFLLARYDDAGTYLGNAISANRANGEVSIPSLIYKSTNDVNSIQAGSASFGVFGATAHYSTGFGFSALQFVTDTSINNTAFGALAGYRVSGSGNTFFGAVSGFGSTVVQTGGSNTAFGALTAYSLTSGAGNSFFGFNVGNAITTGSGNLHIRSGATGNFAYSATENNVFRLGNNATNLMRATNIDTATPQFFLDWLPASTTYASDAAASAGGVLVGQIYRNGSAIQVRVL